MARFTGHQRKHVSRNEARFSSHSVSMKILITDSDFPDLELERGLFADARIEVVTAQCRTEQAVIDAAGGCSALLVQYAPVTERVLAALPQVGLVSRFGAGYDTVDPAACARHGVWLANSPDYGVGEVATHALGMALSLLRHLPFYDRDVKAGRWHYLSPGTIRRTGNQTVGILGLGRIGKRFAHLARNCFGRVIACDPYIIDGDFPAYVERVTLQQLFETADVISLHLPLTGETRGLVGAALLSSIRPGAMLVNTARGAVIDIDALLAALDAGRVSAAALDVLPTEPLATDHPLARHPRVLLSPHAAFYSIEAEAELRRKAALNVVQWAKSGRPAYCVVQGTKKPVAA
jgi:phosphoglycerate dehydrogenase-like enzyme